MIVFYNYTNNGYIYFSSAYDSAQHMLYMYYTLREAKQLFRRQFNLKYKHIKFIELK